MRDTDRRVEAPTQRQWERLYAAAVQLRDARPWDMIWDSDIFRIDLPGHDLPVFCSIMGILGESYGVNLYPGYEAFLGYLRMADVRPGEPDFVVLSKQRCLACHFGNKADIAPEDAAIHEALGLAFKGAHQFVYFRSLRPGFQPWFIDGEAAELMAAVLEQLYQAVRQYERGNIMDAHLKEKMVHHYFSAEKNIWVDEAVDFEFPDMELPKLLVDDELFIAQLNKQKRVGKSLEMDIMFLPTPIQEAEDKIPYLPQMGFLLDAATGELLGQHVLNPGEDTEEDVAMQLLIDYIFAVGRPIQVYVRDIWMRLHLEDVCEKTSIRLDDESGVPLVDEFVKQMLEIMNAE